MTSSQRQRSMWHLFIQLQIAYWRPCLACTHAIDERACQGNKQKLRTQNPELKTPLAPHRRGQHLVALAQARQDLDALGRDDADRDIDIAPLPPILNAHKMPLIEGVDRLRRQPQ